MNPLIVKDVATPMNQRKSSTTKHVHSIYISPPHHSKFRHSCEQIACQVCNGRTTCLDERPPQVGKIFQDQLTACPLSGDSYAAGLGTVIATKRVRWASGFQRSRE